MAYINMSQSERLFSELIGLVMIAATLRVLVGRKLFGLLALMSGGFYLLYRGITGHCAVYERLAMNTAVKTNPQTVSVPHQQGIHVQESTLINRPANELFAFWRKLENLPRFMSHLESVRAKEYKTSHWVANGPAGMKVEWDAQIINEVLNEVIGWRSLPNSRIAHAGSVRFTPEEQGTRVTVTLEYVPPAGTLGVAFADLMGHNPQQTVADDLSFLKQILELEGPRSIDLTAFADAHG